MHLPSKIKYLIIGAGVHGLSTAYHLAKQLKAQNIGSGSDIMVVDKQGVGAGASGIACGVIRNNYFQPAMREIMVHSVEVWESDPKAFSYYPVGYIQAAPEIMHEDVASIAQQQNDIGYESIFIEGEENCTKYMKSIFNDWQAKNITTILHEKRGGYANNLPSMRGLATKVENEGVQIFSDIQVMEIQKESSSNTVKKVITNEGSVVCDYLIVGVGPWIKSIWEMLDLPRSITIKGINGELYNDIPMWVYWSLQEGTLGVAPEMQQTNDGDLPPVLHVDTDAPLVSEASGDVITEKLWGVYYKPDFNFDGVQGGAAPFKIKTNPDDVKVDPYGPESPDYIVDDLFAEMWVSALAHCQKRFEGTLPKYKKEPSGGIGAFTPDSFPVFDVFCDNCYIIADSNHGYKLIGIGKLVAEEIVGDKQGLLEPFRFSRYTEGKLHPVSNSPYPWS